ncbi:hypothetical protein [Natrialba taiwanensis]|uniref:dolichyl-phosphooligosaccharide-protein glycotransferase n=1 Tax=Natrialba taiwanensis DSM 12281 TaxID=1230458 RepID=L9ZWQ0_9EURY|nr:hypothetical protein [Natrialba taiwanensis]ELY90784.1 hypothetical protein C484_11191 [Natrialba taiwanensis DSM 12281]
MADADDPASGTHPQAVADTAASFCEEYDDGEQILETVLAIDADHDTETWTFSDLPLDSGTFGELVSRNIVVKDGGEYRVSSRNGIRAALTDEEITSESESDSDSNSGYIRSRIVAVDIHTGAAFVGALAILLVMRLLNYGAVFRGDRVVSPGNDPYYYRYWMTEFLASSDGLTDWSVVTSMPDGAAERRPFTHAANWLLAEVLGGGQGAADIVTAWLPVVATLALGIVVYWLAVVVTDDVRIGIASVVLLALTPVHAVYSGVGFLEHRLHQYFWLGVTLLALAWLAVDLRRRSQDSSDRTRDPLLEHCRSPWTWVATIVFGIALTFSAYAWGGSVLMFLPVAIYIGLKVPLDVRAGLSPTLGNVPLLTGLGISSALSVFFYLRWGWQESFTAVVSVLLVAGSLGVIVLGEAWHRLEFSVPTSGLIGIEAVLTAVGIGVVRSLRPTDWTRLQTRADDLLFRTGATETGSVFSTDNSIILEPMAHLGINFYLAVIVLGWASWVASRRYEPGWLLLSVYTVFWLVMATLQVRFAAQLAIPLAVLGGLGLVALLAWVDLARVPRPFRTSTTDDDPSESWRTRDTVTDGGDYKPGIIVPRDVRKLATLGWIVLLVCGMSLIFVPSLSAQTTHSDAQLEATTAIEDHALETDREYPATFVLSRWGDNRLYNYFVSGESQSYSYAQNTFGDFQTGTDPDGWYDQFGDRVGYVVLTDQSNVSAEMTQSRLHEEYGTGGSQTDPLTHYQAIYLDEEVTAFAVVPGATITGSGEAGENVTVETETDVSGETLTYERSTTVGDDGTFSVTVPYPGEYDVGTASVDVSRSAVESGESVPLD